MNVLAPIEGTPYVGGSPPGVILVTASGLQQLLALPDDAAQYLDGKGQFSTPPVAAESDPVFAAWLLTVAPDNWDAAYGWGDHGAAGYLTAETDPVFAAWLLTVAPDNWDAAYGWGDHSAAGYAMANPLATDSLWEAKGDLAAATGATAATRLPVGTDGQVLTADAAQATGIKWSDPSGGGTVSVDVQTFSEDGTWTKPEGARVVQVLLIGGGGGGGSGARLGWPVGGGGGGGGAGWTKQTVSAESLGATEPVTVGGGGAGGAAVSVVAYGNDGTDGAASSFGVLNVPGGKGGTGWKGSDAVGGIAVAYAAGDVTWATSCPGGVGKTSTGGTPTVPTSTTTPGGGGGGAGAFATGGAGGGVGPTQRISQAGGAGGTYAAAGGSGSAAMVIGSGGGGGGGGAELPGGSGGAGTRGSGGGGGGAGIEGMGISGAGGNGGDGYVIVITFCTGS